MKGNSLAFCMSFIFFESFFCSSVIGSIKSQSPGGAEYAPNKKKNNNKLIPEKENLRFKKYRKLKND